MTGNPQAIYLEKSGARNAGRLNNSVAIQQLATSRHLPGERAAKNFGDPPWPVFYDYDQGSITEGELTTSSPTFPEDRLSSETGIR